MSLPVAETEVWRLLTTLELRENGAQWQRNAGMHMHAPSTE